jgi:hypothetical protein
MTEKPSKAQLALARLVMALMVSFGGIDGATQVSDTRLPR